MKELMDALEIVRKYNRMSLYDLVRDFEIYSNQTIPKEVVEKFRFTGLNNVDFLRSDFLCQHGLKNLYQV
jgi:hypothetical protein